MTDKGAKTPPNREPSNAELVAKYGSLGTARLPAAHPAKLLKTAAVKSRLGDISSQTLWRYGRDQELDFPKPIKINSVRFWDADEIEAFIERQRWGAAK